MGVHRKHLNDYIFTFGNGWWHRPTPSVGLAAVAVNNIAQRRSQCSLFGRINTQLSISGKACEQVVLVASAGGASLIPRPIQGLKLWKFLCSTFSVPLTPSKPGLNLKAIKVFFPGFSCLSPQLSSFPYLLLPLPPFLSLQLLLSPFCSPLILKKTPFCVFLKHLGC